MTDPPPGPWRFKVGRCPLEDIDLHRLHLVLPAQPDQLTPLLARQPLLAAFVDVGPAHPVLQVLPA